MIDQSHRTTWPLVLASAAVLALVSYSAALRISRPYPLTPWESAIVADAWRAMRALPVYTDPAAGHATHMYGPLVTRANAALFKFFGISLQAPRILSLVAMLITCIALTFALARGEYWIIRLFAFALFSGTFFIARSAYSEARPDAIAVCLAVLGLLFLYRSFAVRSLIGVCIGAAIIVIAALFKQTMIAAILIPIIVAMRSADRRWRIRAIVLLAVIALVSILAIRIAAPRVWFYLAVVPGRWEIQFRKLTYGAFILLLGMLVTLEMLATRNIRNRFITEPRDARSVWLIATFLVACAVSLLGYCKRGGGENSLLPALLAAAAIAVNLLPTTLHRDQHRLRRSLLIGGLMVVQLLAIPHVLSWALRARHGDRSYAQVIARAAQLDGKVICPDDPTIPLFAGRDPGRSLDCELDVVAQKYWPDYLIADIRSADYIIRVHASWDAHEFDPRLLSWGFSRIDDPAFSGATYALWKRDSRADRKQP